MKVKFNNKELTIKVGRYGNNRIALTLVTEDHEPYMVPTVNIPDFVLPENHVFIKNWSENKGILESLVESNIVEETGYLHNVGFTQAHICKLTNDFLNYME